MKISKQIHIAVVEDDSIFREELCHFLRDQTFKVFEAILGLTLDALLMNERIDLILLDVNLPGESGFEIARRIKSKYPQIGIAMLTARTALSDRIKSYDSGADIYLPKPTHPSEILAALKSLIRRYSSEDLAFNGWIVDIRLRKLIINEHVNHVHLTNTELSILMALVQSKTNKIEISELCEIVSKNADRVLLSRRAIENSISRLRKKISDVTNNKNLTVIDSVWGYGYRLCVPIAIN